MRPGEGDAAVHLDRASAVIFAKASAQAKAARLIAGVGVRRALGQARGGVAGGRDGASLSSSRSAAMCLMAWKLPIARPNWMRVLA